MSTITKKFNGNTMARSEHLHGTADALLDYAESAGLITEAHGGKKIATRKWKRAVTDLYSPTGCLREFEPFSSAGTDRSWSTLRLNLVKLMSTLDRKYCKKKFEGILVLAVEEKGHRLWNDWETSSALYESKMVHRNKDQDQTHIAEKYPSANQEQEQGLCHGAIQSPGIARSFQISSTPSQSTTTSQPAHPLLNRENLDLSTSTNTSTTTNLNHTDLQPRFHFPVDERTATRNCVYSNRNISSVDNDDDTIISDEIIDESIAIIGRRPELQSPNPRPNNRQRIEPECEWPQPTNGSLVQYPVNGAAQLSSAHHNIEIDDQRVRNQIEALNNVKKDVARAICSSLASLRQELRTTGPDPVPINVTPTNETVSTMAPDYYVGQTQVLVNQTKALANLANALHQGQNFMTEHSRRRAKDIINSILDRIENGMMTHRDEIEI